jgi:hypothetical protein
VLAFWHVRWVFAGGFGTSEIRSPAARPQPMRYTKLALLTFGAGLLVGLVVVVAEIDWLDRVPGVLMALGVAALPVGMAVDWRLATKAQRRPTKTRSRTPAKRAAAAPRRVARPRKPAPPKR